MNLIILIIAAVSAYVLTECFAIVNGLIAEWELQREEKKKI